MIGGLCILAILTFGVGTDFVQAEWPHAVFRAAACLLCAVYVYRGKLRLSWTVLPLALPVVWGLAQLAAGSTVWTFATWQATLQWMAYLALFLAALQERTLRSNLHWAAWFGGVFSVFAIARMLAWKGPDEAVLGTFLNHNHYAALMELLFPVALWRFFRDRNRGLMGLCAATMLLSVAMSGSRMGALLLLAELVFVGLRASEKPLLVAGVALLVAGLAVGAMWTRFGKLATSEPYDSRNETARASLQMVGERPWLGFGLGTWANVYPAYASRDTGFRLIHADNDWLEWAAEGGWPFVAILVGVAAFALVAGWREPWCFGCMTVLIHSVVEFPMHKQALWGWFVVLLAIAQRPLKARIVKSGDGGATKAIAHLGSGG